jgi:hypothetical protein
MIALRGKRKKPVKICRMENNVVYLTEEPPGSGIVLSAAGGGREERGRV